MRLLKRRSTQSIGLDIGSGLVKAVVVDHAGAVPQVTRVVVTALADDAIVEGEVMDPRSSPTPCARRSPPPASATRAWW
jgi:Tfp pilus assembly PilM family ATPase